MNGTSESAAHDCAREGAGDNELRKGSLSSRIPDPGTKCSAFPWPKAIKADGAAAGKAHGWLCRPSSTPTSRPAEAYMGRFLASQTQGDYARRLAASLGNSQQRRSLSRSLAAGAVVSKSRTSYAVGWLVFLPVLIFQISLVSVLGGPSRRRFLPSPSGAHVNTCNDVKRRDPARSRTNVSAGVCQGHLPFAVAGL